VSEEKRKLRILVVKANDGGCAYYRAIMPLEKLQEHYPDEVEVRFDMNPLGLDTSSGQWLPDWDFENLKWCDIVLMNNISNYGGHYSARCVGKAREFNKFVHVDNDDLLTNLYDEHILAKTYKEKGLGDITKFMYNNAHLVTVTQRKFALRIKEYCGHVLAVVKNAIDYSLPCWNAEVPTRKVLRIGWAGGIHHRPDVKRFSVVPHIVNQKVGRENIHWDFYGHPPPLKEGEKKDWQWGVWEEYRNVLLKGFKGPANWGIHYALPPNMYGTMYANMDVAIAPLQMNEFNDSKSDIKVAESGRYKVPLVGSDVGCYSDTIVNWETGVLLPPDASKMVWSKTMTKLLKNPKLIRTMGNNLHELTEEQFDINKVIGLRLDLYKECFTSLGWDPRGETPQPEVIHDKNN